MNIKIYGKEDCTWCDRAKRVLQHKGIAYDYSSLDTQEDITEVKELYPNATTVPIVVINDIWIGGFTQLCEFLERNEL